MTANKASIKVLEKIGLTFLSNSDFEGQKGVIYQIKKANHVKPTKD